MKTRLLCVTTLLGLTMAATALADVTVTLNTVDENGVGTPVGTVVISESPYGLVFTPALTGLPTGLHGFHLHAKASCEAGEQDG